MTRTLFAGQYPANALVRMAMKLCNVIFLPDGIRKTLVRMVMKRFLPDSIRQNDRLFSKDGYEVM